VPASDIEFGGMAGARGIGVRGLDAPSLGRLEGVMVNAGASAIVYLVIRADIAAGARNYVVPSGEAWVDGESSSITVGVTRHLLQHYPTLDEFRVPDASPVGELTALVPQC
jgi:hypothetical protein